jgi:hypothetical protein
MHLWRPWIVVGLLAAAAGQAAVVYKWIDADGVVHYSDQPAPGAEKIAMGASSERSGTSFGAKNVTATIAAPKKAPSSPQDYTQFEIASPVPDETFTGNAPVNAHLNLNPSLLPNHAITWYLNGSPVADQSSESVNITLKDLARGSYSIAATVVDSESGESRSTEGVTFYVREPSMLSPQHK